MDRQHRRLRISDIYIGKPDAKEEILTEEDLDNFLGSYVLPSQHLLNELLTGKKYYIKGFKGTGKTAILLYLNQYVYGEHKTSCPTCSFLLFKSNYNPIDRYKIEGIARSLINVLDMKKDIEQYPDHLDYEYIWRWTLFKRIVEDNNDNENAIFINDDKWKEFTGLVNKILGKEKNEYIFFPTRNKN